MDIVDDSTPALSDLTPIPSECGMDVDDEQELVRPRRGTRRKANAVAVPSSESEDGEVREGPAATKTAVKVRESDSAKKATDKEKKSKAAKGGSAAKKRKTDELAAPVDADVSQELAKGNQKKAGGGRKAAATRREPDDQAGRALGLRVARAPPGGTTTLPRSLRGTQA